MKLLKILTIFVLFFLTASVVSAGYCENRHDRYDRHYRYHDNDGCNYKHSDCNDRGCRGGCDDGNSNDLEENDSEENDSEENNPEENDSEENNPEETDSEEDTIIPPVIPSDDNGITTMKLCRDNVCSVGGTGTTLEITNYNNAVNPTYDQLIEFLRADKTDERPYSSNYVCADFAVTLHDNAEKAGIRTGWVGVYGCNHAINIFETTDKGTVYIDCTGMRGGGTQLDAEMDVEIGQPLTGEYLFRSGSVNMGGTIRDLLVYW